MDEQILGTLPDFEIIRLCNTGKLISNNFESRYVKQCCYELRAGNTYFEISNLGVSKKITLKSGQFILIRPHQRVVVITHEEILLDEHYLARILSKGKLFSVGLLPVNTYADPGFHGNLGIVLHNASFNYLKISPLDAIAKIEFCKLHAPVSTGYGGQHGYQTGIWPVCTDYIMTDAEIAEDTRIASLLEESEHSQGRYFYEALKRIGQLERGIILSATIYFSLIFALLATISGAEKLNTILSIAVGLLTNFIFFGFTYFLTNGLSEKKNKK